MHFYSFDSKVLKKVGLYKYGFRHITIISRDLEEAKRALLDCRIGPYYGQNLRELVTKYFSAAYSSTTDIALPADWKPSVEVYEFDASREELLLDITENKDGDTAPLHGDTTASDNTSLTNSYTSHLSNL